MPGLVERDQVGRREDFADLIAVADVKSTPFVSQVNKGREPVNTLFDWQVDAYEDPVLTGTVDGLDVENYENAAQNRAKLRNHVQVHRRTAKVSRLAENVSDVAGLGKKRELANSIRKKLVEIKRDIEASCLSLNDAQDDDGSNPNISRALGVWISNTAHSYLDFPAQYKPDGFQLNTTAVGSLTEDTDLQDVLQAVYDATGFTGDYALFCGSDLRRQITTMTRVVSSATEDYYTSRTFNQASTDKKISSSTSFYDGDYGMFRVISSSFIGWVAGTGVDKDRGYLLDMKRVHLRYNQMPTVERLPDLGGGPRVLVEAVCGLQFDNPLCSARWEG